MRRIVINMSDDEHDLLTQVKILLGNMSYASILSGMMSTNEQLKKSINDAIMMAYKMLEVKNSNNEQQES